MHIPDGFLTAPVWGSLAAVSLPAVSWVTRRAQAGATENQAPMLGVMGAFVFAAQMINFPVAAGASGHLVGAALLAVTVGPWAASVVMTAILVIQALIFQDGGLMALGANVFNMALAAVAAGWLPYLWLGARWRRVALFAGGMLSVLAASSLALAELSLSGASFPRSAVIAALAVFGVNALLEGVITVAVVEAIARVNPRWIRTPRPVASATRMALACAAVLMAVGAFWWASRLPDGIERLLASAGGRQPSALLALLGLSVTFLLCYAVGRWITRWRSA